MPFETKPRLVRKPSQNSKSDATASKQSLASPSVPQMDFQPRGGVTFTQNRSSDVEIVGKGYGDEPHQTDPRPSQYAVKAKEKRSQNAKGDSESYPACCALFDFIISLLFDFLRLESLHSLSVFSDVCTGASAILLLLCWSVSMSEYSTIVLCYVLGLIQVQRICVWWNYIPWIRKMGMSCYPGLRCTPL